MTFKLTWGHAGKEVLKGGLNAVGGIFVYALFLLVVLGMLRGPIGDKMRGVVFAKSPYLSNAIAPNNAPAMSASGTSAASGTFGDAGSRR